MRKRAVRADVLCLVLLVENNQGTQLLRVQEAVQDFLELAKV